MKKKTMALKYLNSYFQYGRMAEYSGEWKVEGVGSCLFFNSDNSLYYYITIISGKGKTPKYKLWIAWGKIYKKNKVRQIGSYTTEKMTFRETRLHFTKKCQTKLKKGYQVQNKNPFCSQRGHWYLPEQLSSPVWSVQSRFVESSLKKIERDWSDISDKVTKQWAGRGLRICLGVFLWEFPYPSNSSYTYTTLVRGIQMRFLHAFTGFEMIVLGWTKLLKKDEDPNSFTRVFYTSTTKNKMKDLMHDFSVQIPVPKNSKGDERDLLEFLTFLNINKNGQSVLKKKVFNDKRNTLDWSDAISVATTFRHLIAHGALSPSQSINHNFVDLLIALTELLLSCSERILSSIVKK